jgi:dipeptidyl aminopeptidase/acylaminoacyl peptidase
MNQIRVDPLTLPLTERITRTGYLLQPADAQFPPRAVPLVLYQQGGPGGAMTNRWGATPEEPFNLLPNFGIAVLFMPFSGREGFGPKFLNALVDGRKFGAADIDEAAQAVQALMAQGYTTPGQVGITGCSYGGYFTSHSLVRHPELYAAANAQCAPLDLVHWWQSVGRLLVTYVEGRLPSESRFEYRQDSPLQRAARIRTPLLLFHAAEDFLPVALARDFHDQIAATGSPVTLLVFEQEGHTLSLPTSRYLAGQCQIVWFRRYLGITADRTPVCLAAPADAQAATIQ